MVERSGVMRNRGPSKRVGSGVLLGGGATAGQCCLNGALSWLDRRGKTSLPIRAFERPAMFAGEEPFTSGLAHALGSAFSIINIGVNC